MEQLKTVFQKFIKHFKAKKELDALEKEIEEREEEHLSSKLKKLCPILSDDGQYAPLAGNGGWNEALEEFYKQVEALHVLYYKSHRVRVRITEMKEKFGTLRLDTSVGVDLPKWKRTVAKACAHAYDFLSHNIDFKMEKVVDVPAYVEHVEKEILKSEYLQSKTRTPCSNQKFFKRDGKYYCVTDYDHYENSHQAPTRHKLLYALKGLLFDHMHHWNWKSNPTREQSLVAGMVRRQVSQLAKEARDRTWHSCERCGCHVESAEDIWSPRCQTLGWVSYLCAKCAAESGNQYYKNGDLWQGDKMLKSKADLEREAEEEERAYKEQKEKNRPAEEALEKEIAEAKAEEAKQLELEKNKNEEAH